MSFEPNYAIPPGETLQDIMDERKWSVMFVADYIQKDEQEIKNLIEGKLPISEEVAVELNKLTGINHQFWLNLERNYQETLKRLEN